MNFDFAEGKKSRALRNQIDNAAGAACAIDRSCRSPQNRNSLQSVRLETEQAIRAVHLAQAIAEHTGIGDIDAADGEGVITGIEAVAADSDARRIG